VTDADDRLDELIRRANPVAEERVALPADEPAAQFVYEQITGTPYGGRRPRRPRLPWVIAALVALTGLGGGVAYATLTPGHVTRRVFVLCYGEDGLHTPAVGVLSADNGPIAACAGAWETGQVGHGPVPLLAACVAPSGTAAVFPSAPGTDICAQLGLARLGSGSAPGTSAPTSTTLASGNFIEARDAIIASLREACLDSSAATATVRQILDSAGVHWTVAVPTPFAPDRPCASPAFDEDNDRVLLIGIPASDFPSTTG
jgi:hypothetical protein